MRANQRCGLVLVMAALLTVGISTSPSRAADDSKALKDRVKKLEKKVTKLEKKLANVRVIKGPVNGMAGPHLVIEGCNVHIRSGSGDTTDGTVDLDEQTTIPDAVPVGLGNLIVGYNEPPMEEDPERGGSHNLVVGPRHNYPSVGGVIAGQQNSVAAPLATVTGGHKNVASGFTAGVTGGILNRASGVFSSVSGGFDNTAIGDHSNVSGGFANVAGGEYSSVSGG